MRGTAFNILGGAGRVVQAAFPAAGIAIYGADVFGGFALVSTAMLIASASLASGFGDAAQRLAARDPARALDDAASARVHASIAGALLWSLVGTIGVAVAIHLGGARLTGALLGRPDLARPLAIAALSLPLASITMVLTAAIRALMFMGADVIVKSFVIPFTLVGAAAALHPALPGAEGLAWAWVASQAAGALAALVAFARHYSIARILLGWRRAPHREVLSFSLAQSANFALYEATWHIDLLTLGAFGAADRMLALYRAVSELARQVFAVRVAFSSAYASLAARYSREGNRDGLRTSFVQVSRWLTFVAAPVAALIFLLAAPLLRAIEPDLPGDVSFLGWLLVGALAACAVGLAGNILLMSGRPHVNLVNGVVIAILDVALARLLVPAWGLHGAAIATMSSLIALQILQVAEVRWLLGVAPRPGALWPPLAAAAGAAAGALALARTTGHDLLAGPAFAALFAPLGVLAWRRSRPQEP